MAVKIRLLVCQNLMREVAAIVKAERLDEVEIAGLRSRCHYPATQAKQEAAEEINLIGKTDGRRTHVIGCECLKGLALPPVKPGPGYQPKVDQCFELLIGRKSVEYWIREGAYLLTPGWLSRWREYVGYWGFDRKTAREFFAESALRLVLLDSGIDPQSAERLQAFATFVARPFQTVPVSLDFLRLHLLKLVLEDRLEAQGQSAQANLDEAKRKLGGYAMVYDLVGRLTAMRSEGQVIESVFELFTMLFAPARLIYVPLTGGKPGAARSSPASVLTDPLTISRLTALSQEYAWTGSGQGFLLRIGGPDETVGVLEVETIAFPQYREHYLNLALSLAKVCGLAIRNARTYERLEHNIGELQEALAHVKTLSGLLPICASCKKIRDDRGYWDQIESYISRHSAATFSHGLCPDCIKKYYPDFRPGHSGLNSS